MPCLRLQEQQAPTQRLVDYGRRWLGWFTAGVELALGYTEVVRQQLQVAEQLGSPICGDIMLGLYRAEGAALIRPPYGQS